MSYNRTEAVIYARKWALSRNPAYYDFEQLGGDCTNFISQCLFAGAGIMNYTKDTGWYFNSLHDRSAAWSGVEFLHRFLVNNKGAGPYGSELPFEAAQTGDVIQLSFDGEAFTHTLMITELNPNTTDKDYIKICCHTYDSLDRYVGTYAYEKIRLIHIDGVRGY